jgi:GTPase SAR1 family protein/nucleotide-binding universal stress UspA family protein
MKSMSQTPDSPAGPPRDPGGPWAARQVKRIDSWPDRRDQPVSVALSPSGARLALAVGDRLTLWDIVDGAPAGPPLQLPCGLQAGLAWSPSGDRLAFRGENGKGQVVDLQGQACSPETKPRVSVLGSASAVAFLPDSDQLAVLTQPWPGRMTLQLVGADGAVRWEQALPRDRIAGFQLEGVSLAPSPDGSLLACTTGTSKAWVFETATGRQVRQLDDHAQTVTGLGWLDGERLLSASRDATMRVSCPADLIESTVVETIEAAGMVFVREQRTALVWSPRGELLAWSLTEHPAELWDRPPQTRSAAAYFTRSAVSAVPGLLALVDAGATDLLLVSDWDRVASVPSATTTYANAKVLLLGDSGVGKSGLAMVLAGTEFTATESTHGRRIWPIRVTEDQDPACDSREIILWDLAGQPGYRIVHQLHLEGAAVALILFDAKSEVSPLDGVEHWARAIRRAHPAGASELTAFLVAGRADRGGISVSSERIGRLKADFGLAAYFTTSAMEGTNILALRAALFAAIDWSRIPKVTSTTLFAAVKQFVVDQTSKGILLAPVDKLCRDFQDEVPAASQLLAGDDNGNDSDGADRENDERDDDTQGSAADRLLSVFEGCIARLESAGLVKRLKFGNYVLLQPELLDAYAGAIVDAAREEPDGLGTILEDRVVGLDFPVPTASRVQDKRQEVLLVNATLEELLRGELALRQPTPDGVELVFPTALRRDLPASQEPHGDRVVFRFEGLISSIYATLIVRLARSGVFTRLETWQSAARFAAADGESAETGECVVALRYAGEGVAALWIGYDRVPGRLRRQFERFVHEHLDDQAVPGTVTRERRYSCPRDGIAFTPEQVRGAIANGKDSILCPACGGRVSLRDDYETDPPTEAAAATRAMHASADAGREIAAASAVVRGKEEVAEFDVFLCHNWNDKPAVREIARQLRERGLRPWLDERQLRPGEPWLQELEDTIEDIGAAAVIVGERIGDWQRQEIEVLLRQRVKRRCILVPVLLRGASQQHVRGFLGSYTWVDMNVLEPDPLDRLFWGITGKQPPG